MRGGPPALRRSFAWNFVGNTLYSLAQWLLLVLLARLSDPEEVGRFSLTLAISAPIFLALGMNLRVVQATDAARRWLLEDYLVLRHLLNALAVVVTLFVGLVLRMDSSALAALLAVSGAKAVESVSQTYYGFFQQSERHEFVSQSMIARSVTGPSLFAIGYAATGELAGGCLGLLLGWSLPQQLLDRRRARGIRRRDGDQLHRLTPVRWPEIRQLARKSAPLGLDQGVSSLSVNIPRYLVQGSLGSAQLGVFAALSYLAQAISMVTGSLGTVVMPRLAIYHHQRRPRPFVRLLVLMSVVSVLVVVAALLGALVVGEWFIESALGKEYVDQELLVALLLSAGAITLQRCICRGLAGAQRFTTYLVIDSVTALIVAGCAAVMIPLWGVEGAAWATTVGFTIGGIVAIVPVVGVVRDMENHPSGE